MTIPVWDEVIEGVELVPGQDFTADLASRMYLNIFAVLGIDPDSVSKPGFSLGPSKLMAVAFVDSAVSVASTKVGTVAGSGEWLDLDTHAATGGSGGAQISVASIDVVFTSGGVPLDVSIVFLSGAPDTPSASSIVTCACDNVARALYTADGSNYVWGQATFDSTYVYFYLAAGGAISIPLIGVLRQFQAKTM